MSRLSLKNLIPMLGKAVDMTPAALYERQRALVRAGLVQREPGRGPGSGVRATSESVAMLLIALLATDSLSQTESQAKRLAQLRSVTKLCPLTGKKTFATALAAVLASEDLAKRVRSIHVERGGTQAGAVISFETQEEKRFDSDKWEGPQESRFGLKNALFVPKLSVRATIRMPFHAIANDLRENR